MNESWYYYEPNAAGYRVTFSADTYVESGYDKIYFYDHLLNPLTFTEGSTTYESFTGSQLQNKTLTIQDTGFYIDLQSDGSLSGYGFRFASIIPLYPEDPVVILYTCEQSSATRARLTYNKVTGADGYRISRSSSESGSYIYARTSLDVFLRNL